MAMHVISIREAARERPTESLSANVTNFLEREKTSAWYEQYKRTETKPPHVLHGRVSTKITLSLADVMHDINDNVENLLDKLQSYSRSLPDSQKLTTDKYKLKSYPREQFLQLQVPVLKFQETDLYTIHHLRCTLKWPFRGGVDRNDWVWVAAGNEKEFGALRGRLPGQLRCLFQLHDPTKKCIHRLALVKMLKVDSTRLLESDSSLIRVGLRKVTVPGNDEWVVGISAIAGIVHLIPAREEGVWLLNSRIDLKTFNDVY